MRLERCGRMASIVRVAVAVAVAALVSCTTYVQPTHCAWGASSCGGIHDARFCEYVAVETQGADCATRGLAPSKPFCVVTSAACTDTSYELRDDDCKVLRYERVRDSHRAECAPDTPMFVTR